MNIVDTSAYTVGCYTLLKCLDVALDRLMKHRRTTKLLEVGVPRVGPSDLKEKKTFFNDYLFNSSYPVI